MSGRSKLSGQGEEYKPKEDYLNNIILKEQYTIISNPLNLINSKDNSPRKPTDRCREKLYPFGKKPNNQ